MRVGLGVSEDLPIGRQQAIAARVEELRFSSLWTNEAMGRDALLVCQAWGAATSELAVGVGVAPIWTRSPAQLGMAAATLQEATGGRFLLGIGVSHPATMDPWHGAGYGRPLSAARDTLTILRQVLGGDTSDHEGTRFSSRRFRLALDPLPPPVRLYLAAMGPKMLALGGELADGVLLNWSTPQEVGRAASAIRASATRAGAGRVPSSVEVAAYVRVAVDEDRQAAREALARQVTNYIALPAYAEHFARQGFRDAVAAVKDAHRVGGADAAVAAVPERMLRDLGWYGTPKDSPGALARYANGGLDHLIARVVPVGADVTGSVERVATAVSRLNLT